MIFNTRLVFLATLLSLPTLAFAESTEVAEAKNQVEQYRALRRACSITNGDQRKACFSQLNAATLQYKEAKQFLASRPFENTSSRNDANLVGRSK